MTSATITPRPPGPAAAPGPPSRGRPRPRYGAIAAIALWAAVIVAGYRLGYALYSRDFRVHIGNAPLVGSQDIRASWRLSGAVVLAALALAYAPAVAARARWGVLLVAGWATGAAWAVLLAAGDGWSALPAPLQSRYEYLAGLPRARAAADGDGGFLRSFVDVLPSYPTHVKGHPPGFLLLLGWLDDLGLGGATVATVLVVAAGALAAPAALVALRAVADEAAARRAAPFLVFNPGAVWLATSADALFLGVSACGVALMAMAVTAADVRRRAATALAGGLVLGVALHLSYGIAPLGLLVLALLIWRRAALVGALAAAGLVIVVAAFSAAGFFWPDGLSATRDLYHAGVASRRPYADFLVINLGAFFIAIGPAVVAGIMRLRDRRIWLLAGGGLAAVAVAQLSGLSRGETERIWLPFTPWLLVVTAALGASRKWLALQLLLALVVQATVRSPW
ncbi:hypothetical protein [Paraconexibacter sp. AEG42_29]